VNGLEIATRIQEQWPSLLSRFVFTTGDNMEFSAEQRALRDCTRVLLKPFEFSELRTLVAELSPAVENAS
jgi:CheY-like chemotaxis protein